MTVHFANHPADTAPVLCGRWVPGGSCDRPVGHEGRCLTDDEREMRLDGCSWARPEGSTVDPRTRELW